MNSSKRTALLLFSTFFVCVLGKKGFGPTEQDWGYVDVRPGAHLFWWLHYTTADVDSFTDRPLVIWMQGGPGTSGTGYGNFAEIGPLDVDLNPRNATWLNDVNVLFVDNPVGTGFSYVDSLDLLVTSTRQQADDFMVLLMELYGGRVPDLAKAPVYIFCESYGGKYTVEVAARLDATIKNGDLDVDFVGIALGDSLVSPVHTALSHASYLFAMGAIDKKGYQVIQSDAEQVRQAVEAGDWAAASELIGTQMNSIMQLTDNINPYYVTEKVGLNDTKQSFGGLYPSLSVVDEMAKIEVIMNSQVKEALGLDVTWQAQGNDVYTAMYDDISVPVIETLELLLNTTSLKVAVYTGQLDLLCNTLGQLSWIESLNFDGAADWEDAPKLPIVTGGFIEGYYKKYNNFTYYWVDRAGHMVTKDNRAAMRYILEDVTDGFSIRPS